MGIDTAATLKLVGSGINDDFSGSDPFNISIWIVSQEVDGDEALSNETKISFDIFPVVDEPIWEPAVETTEGDLESGEWLSFADIHDDFSLGDADTSEVLQYYTVDLSSLAVDAKIDKRLNFTKGGTSFALLLSLLNGTYTDNGDETIRVYPDDMAGISLSADLFFDSNVDFKIPVEATITDTKEVDGTEEVRTSTFSRNFNVKIVGTTDVPTVFAESPSGPRFSKLNISLGGISTDTDEDWGRNQSESIYYIIVPFLDVGFEYGYSFLNASSYVTGFDGGK